VSRSLSRFQAVLLGLIVLSGLTLGTVGLFAVGSRQWLWSDTFHVRVGFPQVRGIEVGTRVRVKGMDAGEVAEVQVPTTPSDPVLLRLRLDSKVRHLIRADASAQIVGEGMVGSRVIEIVPGSAKADPVADNAIIASKSTPELADVLNQVDGVLHDIRNSEGTLGKLLKDDSAYRELVQMMRQGRGTLSSIQQDADALKKMPIVRSYVRGDPHELLVRPDCERNRQTFAEAELFEPGFATLTGQGRQKLDRLVPWLEGLKHKGSEVVVASYADGKLEPQLAQTLSQKQSEAVCTYLKDHHAVQKMGWFSKSRKVTPLGLGVDPPPVADKDQVPAPRIEVLVFVPRG